MAQNWQWGSQIANKEKLSNGDVGPKGLFSQLFYGKYGYLVKMFRDTRVLEDSLRATSVLGCGSQSAFS